MSIEYVRLFGTEKIYGSKRLLLAELSLLSSLKHYKEYQRLRTEELAHKIALKKSIEETQNSLRVFDALIPKLPSSPKEKREAKLELQELEAEEHSLEREIDNIKHKLEKLQ